MTNQGLVIEKLPETSSLATTDRAGPYIKVAFGKKPLLKSEEDAQIKAYRNNPGALKIMKIT